MTDVEEGSPAKDNVSGRRSTGQQKNTNRNSILVHCFRRPTPERTSEIFPTKEKPLTKNRTQSKLRFPNQSAFVYFYLDCGQDRSGKVIVQKSTQGRGGGHFAMRHFTRNRLFRRRHGVFLLFVRAEFLE